MSACRSRGLQNALPKPRPILPRWAWWRRSSSMPPSTAGAPLPHVFADEGRLLIAYIVDRLVPSFDGTNPRSISSATESQSIAILTADPYRVFQFGPPNDEAISGHRLYGLGLKPY